MNKIIETIKEIHNRDICMFKVGTFYHIYNKDAEILSYIFKYKIKEIGENLKECGFPIAALPKVMAKLENLKINYLTLDRRNNYDVDAKEDYKKLNNYEKYYEKAHRYINNNKRIKNLTMFLEENIEKENFKELMKNLEDVVYERRKI